MKVFLLHGDNIAESRLRLSAYRRRAKEKKWDIIALDGKDIDLDQLQEAVRSQPLFALGQLVVVENLLSSNRNGSEILRQLIEDYIEKHFRDDTGIVLVLWEKKTIDGRRLRRFARHIRIEAFKLPKSLFNFLDSLGQDRGKMLKILKEAKKENPPEMLLAMIGRQVRLLIQAKDSKNLKIAAWQKEKLKKQAARFTLSQLTELHHRLLELDRLQKRSQLPADLYSCLDLLIAGV